MGCSVLRGEVPKCKETFIVSGDDVLIDNYNRIKRFSQFLLIQQVTIDSVEMDTGRNC